jgi:signal transduction histidine kinase
MKRTNILSKKFFHLKKKRFLVALSVILLLRVTHLLAQNDSIYSYDNNEYGINVSNIKDSLLDKVLYSKENIDLHDYLLREKNTDWQVLNNGTLENDFSKWKHQYLEKICFHNPTNDTLFLIMQQPSLEGGIIFSSQKVQKLLLLTDSVTQTHGLPFMAEQHTFYVKMEPKERLDIIGKCVAYGFSPLDKPRLYNAIQFERSSQFKGSYMPRVMSLREYARFRALDAWKTPIADSFGLGYLLLAFFFSVFLYYLNRDEAYLFYAFFAFILILYAFREIEAVVFNYQYSYQIFSWVDTKVFFLFMLILAYMQFIRYFLNLNKIEPAFNNYLKGLVSICILVILIDAFIVGTETYNSWLIYDGGRIIGAIIGLISIVYLKQKKIPNINFILAGTVCLFVSDMITRFSSGTIAMISFRTGVFLELAIFAFGLAYKTKNMVQGKVLAEKQYVEQLLENQNLLRGYQNELEREVAIQSRKLVELEKARTLEQTRSQIAHDIHDEIGSRLTKISLSAHLASLSPDTTVREMKVKFDNLSEDARQTIDHLREIIFSINPEYDDFSEMQIYFREIAQYFWHNTAIKLNFDFGGETIYLDTKIDKVAVNLHKQVSPNTKRQLLFIFKEAQNNIAKHAQATEVWLTLKVINETNYQLEVKDNGNGAVPEKLKSSSQGLIGMRKRADSISASFLCLANPNQGTLIRVEGSL